MNRSEQIIHRRQSSAKWWHVEEFFNLEQDMGCRRITTLNFNVRYAHASFALVTQAALHQLRQRLDPSYAQYTSEHFAQELFARLGGDLRVH